MTSKLKKTAMKASTQHERLAKRRVRALLKMAGPDDSARGIWLGLFIARHLNQMFTEFPEQAANYSRRELEALRAERSIERLEPFAVKLAELLFALRAGRGPSSPSVAKPLLTVH